MSVTNNNTCTLKPAATRVRGKQNLQQPTHAELFEI
jgi:hypothetical protein